MFEIWSVPALAWSWIAANALIGLSYLIIGTAQMREYAGTGHIYGAFIFACGVGHFAMIAFMAVWPVFWLWVFVVIIDVFTAAISHQAALHWRKG